MMRALLNPAPAQTFKLPDIIAVMAEDRWLGKWFAGDSWLTWQSVLKAAFALPMSDDDLRRFAAVAGNREPPSRVRELWVIAGRRSGKDSIASLLATYSLVFNQYQTKLRPGEKATCVCLAVDRNQSRIVHRYISAYFRENAALSTLVVSDQDELLELNNSVEVVVATNSFRALRGRAYSMAILDEVCLWRDESSANPDVDTYESIDPGFASLDGMCIGISTPYMRSGLAYAKWEKHYGKNDDDVLVVGGPSIVFNPTIPQRVIDTAMARDSARARAEWLGEWRDSESAFLSVDLIRAAVDTDIIVRPPDGQHYFGFVDAAGGAGSDSFTAAVCHRDGTSLILDAVYERQPPFSPQSTTEEIADLFKQYRISRISGDKYAGDWPAEAFRRCGVAYEASKLSRSEIYVETIPLFTSGRVRLLDNKKLVDQFAGLRRKVIPGGREDITHQPNAHDDLCNSVAGVLTLAGSKKMPLVIDSDFLAKSKVKDFWKRFDYREPPSYL